MIAPVNLIEFEVEVENVQRMQHVYECEADRTLRLQIHGQIKVVVLAQKVLVYQFEHVSLQELYRDVPDHQSGQGLYLLIIFIQCRYLSLVKTLMRLQDFHQVYLVVFRPNEHLLFHFGIFDVFANFWLLCLLVILLILYGLAVFG